MDRDLLNLRATPTRNGRDSEQQMESEFYLQARREWDERYGDLVLGKRNWQITSAGLMLLSLILALGIVWMSARTKVIPFVVEVDKLGYAITIPAALTASTTPTTVERMKRYEIAAFIRNARSVTSDPVVEQNMLNDLLAHAHGAANRFLESYFHADDFVKNPFQIMKHRTVDVQIESILQASPKSYQVRWSETARDLSGAPLGTSHWEAMLETELSPQNSTDTVISNPLGFYVTRISWAEQQS
jgi:type IV secretion system protein TrbF